MPYTTPDYRQIRADILRDIANQMPGAYTGEDSDFAVRANAVASSIEGLYEHQKWIVRQVFPDTSDSDYLERHASLRGIARKAASFATGTVHFSGTVGSAVPISTEAKTNSGIAFVTTAAGVIGGGGTVDIADLQLTDNLDADGDTLPNKGELDNGLDPLSDVGDNGAAGDPDGDGVPNRMDRAPNNPNRN